MKFRIQAPEINVNFWVFYFGIPLTVGYICGAFHAGIAYNFPTSISILFWMSLTWISWLIYHFATSASAALLNPSLPPLTVKLFVGVLIASLPVRFFTYSYIGFFDDHLLNGVTAPEAPPFELSIDFFQSYLKSWAGIYVLWVGANLFFDRQVGMSRYRDKRTVSERNIEPEITADDGRPSLGPTPENVFEASGSKPAIDETKSSPKVSLFLSRLPEAVGYNIKALRSEDHYVRTYTDSGESLQLFRLSDAVGELERLGYNGLQVHRSYWVSNDAVKFLEIDGRKWRLLLDNGLSVPVSQTYREAVTNAGFPEN